VPSDCSLSYLWSSLCAGHVLRQVQQNVSPRLVQSVQHMHSQPAQSSSSTGIGLAALTLSNTGSPHSSTRSCSCSLWPWMLTTPSQCVGSHEYSHGSGGVPAGDTLGSRPDSQDHK
jgi:hypothetical protein